MHVGCEKRGKQCTYLINCMTFLQGITIISIMSIMILLYVNLCSYIANYNYKLDMNKDMNKDYFYTVYNRNSRKQDG